LIHGTALIQLVITLPAEIPWGFDNFQRYKTALTSSNDSLRSLNVYCSSPRPLPYFILPMKALCGALGKDGYGISVLSILQSQKMDPWRYRVIQTDRDVHVCGYEKEEMENSFLTLPLSTKFGVWPSNFIALFFLVSLFL
jgi:hypothetical protein